ncbi:MAG: putative motility protein [Candidatus Thiodiazotropha sp.]|jgi:hypothetical protein
MDIAGVSTSAVSTVANAGTETSVAMQKKVMEMQEQVAVKLIQSVEQSAPKPNPSSSVGNNIDIKV